MEAKVMRFFLFCFGCGFFFVFFCLFFLSFSSIFLFSLSFSFSPFSFLVVFYFSSSSSSFSFSFFLFLPSSFFFLNFRKRRTYHNPPWQHKKVNQITKTISIPCNKLHHFLWVPWKLYEYANDEIICTCKYRYARNKKSNNNYGSNSPMNGYANNNENGNRNGNFGSNCN